MNSRKQPRKWDSGFTQTRKIFSATRAPSIRTQKKDIKSGEMSIEILTRNESVKYLGQRTSFYQQETTEIKSRIRCYDSLSIQKGNTKRLRNKILSPRKKWKS